MEDFILDSVNFIGNIDFGFVLKMFFYVYLFFWVMVVIWVWFDASERSSNVPFKVFSVLITLLFNVFGLLIYLLVRPVDSYEERYLNELEKKYLQLETSGIMQCPNCSFDLEPNFVVCPRCGEPIKVKCDNCREYIDGRWGFCAYCGVERDVSENVMLGFSQEKKEYAARKGYHAALGQCLFKIGEKQNQCIEKVRNSFKSFMNKRTQEKVEKEYVKTEGKKKKNRKKGKGKKRK